MQMVPPPSPPSRRAIPCAPGHGQGASAYAGPRGSHLLRLHLIHHLGDEPLFCRNTKDPVLQFSAWDHCFHFLSVLQLPRDHSNPAVPPNLNTFPALRLPTQYSRYRLPQRPSFASTSTATPHTLKEAAEMSDGKTPVVAEAHEVDTYRKRPNPLYGGKRRSIMTDKTTCRPSPKDAGQ